MASKISHELIKIFALKRKEKGRNRSKIIFLSLSLFSVIPDNVVCN